MSAKKKAVASRQPPNKQLQRRRGDGASASFHYALAPRVTQQRAAAELRRQATAVDGAAVFDGSGKLTDLFGYWPSFHDAEVHELLLDRGDVNPDRLSYVFPILTVKVHVFEITNEVDSAGYFVLTKHTLVTLRFHDVEDCRLDGFNHQNAILGLTITEADSGSRKAPLWAVRMEAAFGLDASFKCSKCEVIAVLPCDKKGRLLA